MKFVKSHFPLVPVPDVIFSRNEGNTYFLMTKSAIGDPLQATWGLLTTKQRIAIAKEVADYSLDLFSATSSKIQNVSGGGHPDTFLQLQDGKVTALIDWKLVGYYPAFWVRFKAYTHGMMLSTDKETQEETDKWEWTRHLYKELS
ncbi:hypothetical protein D6C98_08729 [Aureobasidium pullulans]|nr:hypothetical protein D6C98_08729 [Aureobasidium pullulans]